MTRVSIDLHQNAFRRKVDGRVKPGHDRLGVHGTCRFFALPPNARLIVIGAALNSM
jgi:hypothetical protein